MASNKFYIFLGFPFIANLIVANNFTIPNYYQELSPVITYFIKKQNKKLLGHLKEQFKKYPEQFAGKEENVFLEIMNKKEFDEWRNAQLFYQFDRKIAEAQSRQSQDDADKSIEKTIKEAMAKSREQDHHMGVENQNASLKDQPTNFSKTELVTHSTEAKNRNLINENLEHNLSSSHGSKNEVSDLQLNPKSFDEKNLDSSDQIKH